MTTPDVSRSKESGLTEPELARRMRAVEKRERQLDQALAAVAAQQKQLAAIRADYEQRRQGLIERAREVQAERERLRAERAEVVDENLSQKPPLH